MMASLVTSKMCTKDILPCSAPGLLIFGGLICIAKNHKFFTLKGVMDVSNVSISIARVPQHMNIEVEVFKTTRYIIRSVDDNRNF